MVFFLLDDGTPEQINQTPFNPCDDANFIVPPTLNSNGALGPSNDTVRARSFTSDQAILTNSDNLGLRVVNHEACGQGNDSALDNIQLLDATPKLDKSFSPAKVSINQTSRMTFTVTNTTDLLAKRGWSFTDTLPDGLLLAEEPNAESNCPDFAIGYPPTRKIITYAGDLDAGQTSCTLSVDVTSSVAGTYTNGPDNLQSVAGLQLPADADVTFVAGAPNTGFGQLLRAQPAIVALATLAGAAGLLYTKKYLTK
jgi:uncharacterized repeat protein (TIGR01451 family)